MKAIKAVRTVEVGGKAGFDKNGRPAILYEHHHFSRLTGRRYDYAYPDIANKLPYKPYRRPSEQYPLLLRAYNLDASAALEATSWGAFQMMGFNHAQAGFGTVQLLVKAMCESARA